GDPRQIDPLAPRARDQLDAALDGREHPQPEQVDLQEARVTAGVLVPLRDLPALHGGGDDRAAIHQRAGGDDHAARVLGEVPGEAVGLGGQPHQPRPAAAAPADVAERALDVAVHTAGGEALRAARDPLDLPWWQAERLAEVADRPACT